MGQELKKIMVIDDEKDVAHFVTKRIQAHGYETSYLLEGKNACDAIRNFDPNLILLDVWMPAITGIDVFKELRADPALKNIPVLFFSADLSQEDYCVNQLG